MKIKFDKKQKKHMLITVAALSVTGVFVYSTFNSTGSSVSSPEETSINNSQNTASNLTNNNPDVESLIDESSPLFVSAREAEEREAERARNTGETYIGDIFLNSQETSNDVIEIEEITPEPVVEVPVEEPDVPDIVIPSLNEPVKETGNGEKRIAQITLEEIRNVNVNSSGANLSTLLQPVSQERMAGGLTTFIEYDRESFNNSNNENNMNNENISNNSNELAEAYIPGQRNRANELSNVIKVTLGSKFYGTVGFAINSDDGGPALAIIEEGPLKGAKLQGEYRLNELAKAVNIQYDQMSYKGEKYDISAIAYDLETDRPVLADRVNNRRFERYGGLALSAFVAGYADTLRDTDTTVTDGGNVISESNRIESQSERIQYALSEPARMLAQELRSNVNRPITVYVNGNKGTGIYFLDDVEIIQ